MTIQTVHLTLHQALGWQAKALAFLLLGVNVILIVISYQFGGQKVFDFLNLQTITPVGCNKITFSVANSIYFTYSWASVFLILAALFAATKSTIISIKFGIGISIVLFLFFIPFIFLNFTEEHFLSSTFLKRTCRGGWQNILYLFQMSIFSLASFYIFGLVNLVARIKYQKDIGNGR